MTQEDDSLRKIARHIPGVIYQFRRRADGTYHFPYASPGALDIYGVPPEAMRESADAALAVIHPNDFDRVAQSIDESAANMTPWSADYRIRHPKRGEIWVRGQSTPERAEDGTIVWHGCITDITQERAASDRIVALKQEADALRERFELAVAGADDGVWDWDLLTGTVFSTPRNFEMLGEEATPGRDFFPVWEARVVPEDLPGYRRRLMTHVRHDTTFDETYRVRNGAGDIRWWRTRGQAVRDEAGRAVRVVGLNSDVTELVEARREAERTNRLKTEFLANMSHEIRTPLNGVLGMAEILRSTELDPRQASYLDIIVSSGDMLLTLINDVLDLSRIEAGLIDLKNEPFLIGDLLMQAKNAVIGVAQTRNLPVLTEVASGLDEPVLGDGRRLLQVLINLAGNAVKFTEEGQVALRARRHDGDRVRFEVVDTGPGISEKDREVIFDRFHQADNSSTRKHGGTGLGLSIAREIVARMGGELGVTSVPGEGATFWFEVPLSSVPTSHLDSPARPQDEGVTLEDPHTPHILVVEDNPINRLLVREALASLPVHASEVENGAEALDKLEGDRFDLILMDLQMPHLNGEETLRRIRASDRPYKDVPVVIVTANVMGDVEALCRDAGADGFLTKPVDVDRLRDEVARYVGAGFARAMA
ncbi:MAG: ATP-binding protein [Pseudomonadota bacterium]